MDGAEHIRLCGHAADGGAAAAVKALKIVGAEIMDLCVADGSHNGFYFILLLTNIIFCRLVYESS